jgi:hypothetical protein
MRIDDAERAHQSRILSVPMGQCQIGEEPPDTLVEDGPVVAARLLAEGTIKPRFADAGRPFDNQVLRYLDPVALGELLEQAAIVYEIAIVLARCGAVPGTPTWTWCCTQESPNSATCWHPPWAMIRCERPGNSLTLVIAFERPY